MKTRITWFDRIMTAVTFAEANEPEAGKELLAKTGRKAEKGQKCRECESVLTHDMHGAKVR